MDTTAGIVDIPETIDKSQLRDILCSTWMRHDAMWFYHCSNEIGMELTNRINRAAVRDMAFYEAKKLKKLLGYQDKNPQTYEELQTLFMQMFGMINAPFMRGTLTFIPEESKVRMSWQSCFAHLGISRMGVIESYECGIFERIESWLNALEIKWAVSPQVTGCMMHTDGECYRNYTLYFDTP